MGSVFLGELYAADREHINLFVPLRQWFIRSEYFLRQRVGFLGAWAETVGRWLSQLVLRTFGINENLEYGLQPIAEPHGDLSTRSTQVPGVEEPDLEQLTRSTLAPVED